MVINGMGCVSVVYETVLYPFDGSIVLDPLRFGNVIDSDEWEDGDEYEDAEEESVSVKDLTVYLSEIDRTIAKLSKLREEVKRLYGAE